VTDVRGPEEALGIRLDEIRLNIGTRSTPDRQPPVAVVVVEKHYEARLVSDEEGRATVARAFRCFWQRQADRAHFGERLGDLAWRKPAHPARLFRGRSLRSLHAMELFDGLLDDETLVWLPETAVPGLLARHSELRTAYPSLLAALVVPDRRLAEIARQIPPGPSVLVSVITSGGAGGLLALARHDVPGVHIAAVEPTLRDLDDLAGSAARVISAAAELGPEITVFIELPYAPGWEAAAELIEAASLYGKIAAGQAEPRQVVEQLSILIEADLPFKITCAHNGDWLSLLLVVQALIAGANLDDAAAVIRLDDHRIGATMSGWDPTTQSRVRRRVRRLGTGQVRQVINELARYGELSPP
jgi:hypothetical protein